MTWSGFGEKNVFCYFINRFFNMVNKVRDCGNFRNFKGEEKTKPKKWVELELNWNRKIHNIKIKI